MPAYVIVHYDDVHDPVALERYRSLAAPSVEAFGGRYLVRGNVEKITVEGDWAPRNLVILEFTDVATAKAWYGSDAYAAALDARQTVGPRALTIVDGLAP